MPSRTQIVCLHEGERGRSIDPVFINRLLRSLRPAWIRPWGSNVVRLVPCAGRGSLVERMPQELKECLQYGGDTTLMVWADLDHDMPDGESLQKEFWRECEQAGITRAQFNTVVFVFAKDRLENWIEYLTVGQTDEMLEGPRVTNGVAREAAERLAERCQRSVATPPLPPSLEWSCRNWQVLVARMRG